MATASDAKSSPEDPGPPQQDTLGSFIRMQRQLARLSLREMAAMTAVSNAYFSQVEAESASAVAEGDAVDRGLALGIPAGDLLRQAGITTPDAADSATGERIRPHRHRAGDKDRSSIDPGAT